MTTRRIERVNELLRREISKIVQGELKDPHVGFATITRVETTRDMQYATVLVSVMGQGAVRETAVEHLNKAGGFIQHQMSGRIRLRTMPKLVFKLDSSIDHSMRIEELLKQISDERPPEAGSGTQEP